MIEHQLIDHKVTSLLFYSPGLTLGQVKWQLVTFPLTPVYYENTIPNDQVWSWTSLSKSSTINRAKVILARLVKQKLMWCTENYLAHNWVNHFKYMMSNVFIEKEVLAKRKDFFSTWWPYGNTLKFKTENQGIVKLIKYCPHCCTS